MADNVSISAGTGTTIAADDVGAGVLVQRVKTTWGPDGTANDADVASGKALPIQIRNSTGTEMGTATSPLVSKLSDGTNAVAIKAASTAPVATDPAIVVALSPNGLNANGRAADANSAPMALSTEDVAILGIITETAPASDTASSGLNGRLQRVAQRLTSLIASVLQTTDSGPSWTSVWGVSGVPVTTATTFSTTAATDAPTSGQKLCIDDIIISTDAATKITLAEETSGRVLFGPWYLAANTILQVTVRGKKKLATADKKVTATSVGSANMTLHVGYHSEA